MECVEFLKKMQKTKSTVMNSQVKCTSPPLNPKLTVNMVNNSPHLLLTGDLYTKTKFVICKKFLIRNLMLFIHLQHIYCRCYLLLLVNNSHNKFMFIQIKFGLNRTSMSHIKYCLSFTIWALSFWVQVTNLSVLYKLSYYSSLTIICMFCD